MYQLAHVTNTILLQGKKEGIGLTQMKLQKTLYFLYREYLQQYGDALFAERFETWKYGPVISDVYFALNKYGAKPIKSYMPDATGQMTAIKLEIDTYFAEVFYRAWNKCKKYSGTELGGLTHKEGSAWKKANDAGKTFLRDEDIAVDTVTL